MVKVLMGRVNRPINASTALLIPDSTSLASTSTFTRASDGTYVDPYGQVTTVGVNVARFNNSEYVGENLFHNPRFEGTIPGGSSPTGYAFSSATGITSTIMGAGVYGPQQLPYIDIRYVGTATTSSSLTSFLGSVGSYIPAVLGETTTWSGYVMLVDGELDRVSVSNTERTAAGAYVTESPNVVYPLSHTPQYISTTYTAVGATTEGIQPIIKIAMSIGGTINATLRIMGLQAVRGTATSSTMILPPPGTIGPSSLYIGNRVLIEAARTNLIANPRAEGAVVGVSGIGVVPTGWSFGAGSGILFDIVEVGTDDGISYVDVRMYGTAVGSNFRVAFSSVHAITDNIPYTSSVYLRALANPLPYDNITNRMVMPDESGDVLSLTNTPLIAQRIVRTRTPTAAGGTGRHEIRFGMTIAQSYDMTVRFGGPQFEQAGSPSSLILPPVGVPAASTRALDSWSIPTTGLFKYDGTVQNLALQSQTFDDAVWVKTRANVTADAIASPDAGITADKLYTDLTPANFHSIAQGNIAVTAGQTYTYSVYAKAAEYAALRLSFSSSGFAGGTLANFDLSGAGSATVGGSCTAYVQALSGGWYRCVATSTAITTVPSLSISIGLLQSAGSSISFDGDGVSGVYIWGAQWEVGDPYASQYMTTTATVSTPRTKLAPGTVIVKSRLPYAPTGSDIFGIFTLHAGNAQNRIGMRYSGAGISGIFIGNNTTNSISSSFVGTVLPNTDYTAALSWDDSGVSMIAGGNPVVSNNGPMVTGITTLGMGQGSSGSFHMIGEIESATYYPYRMTSAQLTAATA